MLIKVLFNSPKHYCQWWQDMLTLNGCRFHVHRRKTSILFLNKMSSPGNLIISKTLSPDKFFCTYFFSNYFSIYGGRKYIPNPIFFLYSSQHEFRELLFISHFQNCIFAQRSRSRRNKYNKFFLGPQDQHTWISNQLKFHLPRFSWSIKELKGWSLKIFVQMFEDVTRVKWRTQMSLACLSSIKLNIWGLGKQRYFRWKANYNFLQQYIKKCRGFWRGWRSKQGQGESTTLKTTEESLLLFMK